MGPRSLPEPACLRIDLLSCRRLHGPQKFSVEFSKSLGVVIQTGGAGQSKSGEPLLKWGGISLKPCSHWASTHCSGKNAAHGRDCQADGEQWWGGGGVRLQTQSDMSLWQKYV